MAFSYLYDFTQVKEILKTYKEAKEQLPLLDEETKSIIMEDMRSVISAVNSSLFCVEESVVE